MGHADWLRPGRASFIDLSVRSIYLSSACWRLWEQRGAKEGDVGGGRASI